MIFEEFEENARKYLDIPSVRTVYDIGAGKCVESVKMAELFPFAHVYAFEGSPVNAAECAKRIVNNPRISLIPLCLFSSTGMINFRPAISGSNLYASSVYKWQKTWDEQVPFEQDAIDIPRISLNDAIRMFCLPQPQLIWMDVQAAEVDVCRGYSGLETVWFLHVEIHGKQSYVGTPLYPEAKKYLEGRGLVQISSDPPEEFAFEDFDFVNKNLIEKDQLDGSTI